jgi:sterol desaturase/sphingolipid hydroxylase (fatty acid hydroxylase superfamily)
MHWYHRFEHRNRFLWALHSTHHSVEEVNAINRNEHWFEGMVSFLLISIPLSIIIETPVLTASVLAGIIAAWSSYIHCDVPQLRLPGWLGFVFADYVYHRHHHGREDRFHDRNFAAMFSFWDRLFATQLVQQPNEFPNTGLSDLPGPATHLQYLVHPFYVPQESRQ